VLGVGAARWLQTRAAETAPQVSGIEQARQVANRIRFPQALGAAGAAAFVFATLGLNSNLGRSPVPQLDAAEAAPIAETVVPARVVDIALVGTTEPEPSSGVQAAACEGAVLPLSLPAGATPVSASLVQTGRSGDEPTILDPDAASGFTTVDTGDAGALVGDGALCVTDLVEPLDGAPVDTGLVVSFLDELGNLQILLVPEIVDQVKAAVEELAVLVEATNAQLARYLDGVTQALQETAGADGLTGTLDDVVGGVTGGVDVPDVPTGTTDLPSLPTPGGGGGGVGGVVDDTVSGVEDVVDGVGDTVDGVVCGLLGC
jgi:hypothetical protein